MLKKDIRINATAIWQYLSERGKMSVQEIEELTHYKNSLILLALGWLSKENKVRFSVKNENLYVELSSTPTEIYYQEVTLFGNDIIFSEGNMINYFRRFQR